MLEPETHYIPVRRDFSNLDEALERLHDAPAVEAMTERAYRDVYLSGRNNASVLADQLYQEVAARTNTRVAFPFALARRPSLPVRSPMAGKPVRQLLPHIVTLAEALALQPEARRLSSSQPSAVACPFRLRTWRARSCSYASWPGSARATSRGR